MIYLAGLNSGTSDTHPSHRKPSATVNAKAFVMPILRPETAAASLVAVGDNDKIPHDTRDPLLE
jgi:hypothetical protein